MEEINILGVPIAATNLKQAVGHIEQWIAKSEKKYVTVTGVHGIMESQYDPDIRRIHQQAGMCVPDGMPTVWVGRIRGHRTIHRVYGPDLMLELMRVSNKKGYTHFLYGGKDGVPELLRDRLVERFPNLRVVGFLSPPFRPMTKEEENDFAELIGRLSPDFIWVGLSTPKQERWMAAHIHHLDCRVMVGVGAAFDFHAGLLKQAPYWIQILGLEWFFRLCIEPRRLWWRYFKNNPLFIWKVFWQLIGIRKYSTCISE